MLCHTWQTTVHIWWAALSLVYQKPPLNASPYIPSRLSQAYHFVFKHRLYTKKSPKVIHQSTQTCNYLCFVLKYIEEADQSFLSYHFGVFCRYLKGLVPFTVELHRSLAKCTTSSGKHPTIIIGMKGICWRTCALHAKVSVQDSNFSVEGLHHISDMVSRSRRAFLFGL